MCHVVAAKICCIFSGAAVNTAICLCIRDTHTYTMYIYNIYILNVACQLVFVCLINAIVRECQKRLNIFGEGRELETMPTNCA